MNIPTPPTPEDIHRRQIEIGQRQARAQEFVREWMRDRHGVADSVPWEAIGALVHQVEFLTEKVLELEAKLANVPQKPKEEPRRIVVVGG